MRRFTHWSIYMSTQTISPVVEGVKAEFTRAIERMQKVFAATPDDKINWSPSATARAPIHQVVHAATAIKGMQKWFQGEPFDFSDIQALDASWRADEKNVKTREEANEMLAQSSQQFHSFLDGLSQEQLDSTLQASWGEFPMASAITFPAMHTQGHTSQIEYTQTAYGDLDWHMG